MKRTRNYKGSDNIFKWKHFLPEIILLCVRWYLKYKLSFRDLVEMMAERGLSIAHTTISRRKKLTIIMDNFQSHKTPAVKKWLEEQNGMVEFIFTPKHASWLNQIEIWFKELNQKCLKRSSVKSKEEMEDRVLDWIDTYNENYAHPYNWKFDGILKKHKKRAA